MVQTISLEWKAFNLNLKTVDAWAKANLANCCGITAHKTLDVHFTQQPSEDDVAALELHWESLTEESEEATSYQTAAQVRADAEAEQASLVASASSKLAALGLSDDEIKAILG